MPLKKLHKCNKLGCNNLTRNRYCKEHEYIELEKNSPAPSHYYFSTFSSVITATFLSNDFYF